MEKGMKVASIAGLLMLGACGQNSSSIDTRAKDGSCIRVLKTNDIFTEIRTVREQGDAAQGGGEWWPCRLPPRAAGEVEP